MSRGMWHGPNNRIVIRTASTHASYPVPMPETARILRRLRPRSRRNALQPQERAAPLADNSAVQPAASLAGRARAVPVIPTRTVVPCRVRAYKHAQTVMAIRPPGLAEQWPFLFFPAARQPNGYQELGPMRVPNFNAEDEVVLSVDRQREWVLGRHGSTSLRLVQTGLPG